MIRPAWDAEPGLLLAWAYMNLDEAEVQSYRRYCQGDSLPAREEKRRITSVRRVAVKDREALAGQPCTYCGAPSDTVEHRLAVTRGGTSEPANLLPACWPCNKLKGALSEDEFRASIAAFEERVGCSLAEARGLLLRG